MSYVLIVLAFAPQSGEKDKAGEAIAQWMAPVEFGMSSKKVLEVLAARIDEEVEPRIKAADGDREREKLRKQADRDKKMLERSLVAFEGEKSGWDASLIDAEFAHKNGESMITWWANKERHFCFFVDDKVWKVVVSVGEPLMGKTAGEFKAGLEEKLGASESKEAERAGEKETIFTRRISETLVRGIDMRKAYGAACVTVSDDRVEGWIHKRRKEKETAPPGNPKDK